MALERPEGDQPGAEGSRRTRSSDSARRRIDNAAESLLKYMLFADEALLEAPVKGTSVICQGVPGARSARPCRDGRCANSI